jgi:atypical dual specificity phosphatase
MKELYLPVVDHFEPSVEDLRRAVNFIRSYEAQGKKVYVHCRAGHARSAAAVFAWLLSKDPTVDRKALNDQFCKIRNVRSNLWRQPNIVKFHSLLSEENDEDEDL